MTQCEACPPLSTAHQQPGRIGLAVSGGGDSLAMLELCARLVPGRFMAVTLDHGLRPEAAAEAAMVAREAARLGVPHQTLTWTGWNGQGNLQATARAARYQLIADWARGQQLAEVWLAHTQEDVAETLLMRLGRAAGLDGLARMAQVFERYGQRWRRPLLEVSGRDLRAHLRQVGLEWAEDPSNRDPDYQRVQARLALQALAPLGITVESLARSAAALASSRAQLEAGLAQEWQSRSELQGGDLLLDLSGAGPDLRRRLVQAALGWIGGGEWPARQSALEDLERRLARRGARHTLAGCLLSHEGAALRVARELRAVAGLAAAPGELWDGRWKLLPLVEGAKGADAPALDPPWPAGAELRALGEGIVQCPDWRASGLPRRSLMAGPALWQGAQLLAAPLAGKTGGWQVKLRPSFASSPFAH